MCHLETNCFGIVSIQVSNMTGQKTHIGLELKTWPKLITNKSLKPESVKRDSWLTQNTFIEIEY